MDDKQIKQMLKDASLWLNDASKRWSKDKDIAAARFNGAMNIIEDLWSRVFIYVERPMGGGEGEDNDSTNDL